MRNGEQTKPMPEGDAAREGAEPGGERSPAGAAPDAAASPGVEELRAECEQLRDRWLRAEAELQNFRRRASREREETRRDAEESVFLELLAVADDLERALGSLPGDPEHRSWADGVELVVRRIREYLRRQGVEPVDPLGERFDPSLHEALLEVDAGERCAAGTVTEVALKGYRRGDRALRAARVVVARPRAAEPPRGEESPRGEA
jgi:molecular chaperone GrpE